MLRSMVNGFDREKIDLNWQSYGAWKSGGFSHLKLLPFWVSAESLTQKRVVAFADLNQRDFSAWLSPIHIGDICMRPKRPISIFCLHWATIGRHWPNRCLSILSVHWPTICWHSHNTEENWHSATICRHRRKTAYFSFLLIYEPTIFQHWAQPCRKYSQRFRTVKIGLQLESYYHRKSWGFSIKNSLRLPS